MNRRRNERRPPLAPLAPHQPRPARDAAHAMEHSVRVKRFVPGVPYSAEDAKDLAALFAGAEKFLTAE